MGRPARERNRADAVVSSSSTARRSRSPSAGELDGREACASSVSRFRRSRWRRNPSTVSDPSTSAQSTLRSGRARLNGPFRSRIRRRSARPAGVIVYSRRRSRGPLRANPESTSFRRDGYTEPGPGRQDPSVRSAIRSESP
jgi:hypothetical protein